jgi:hypothetical protein
MPNERLRHVSFCSSTLMSFTFAVSVGGEGAGIAVNLHGHARGEHGSRVSEDGGGGR